MNFTRANDELPKIEEMVAALALYQRRHSLLLDQVASQQISAGMWAEDVAEHCDKIAQGCLSLQYGLAAARDLAGRIKDMALSLRDDTRIQMGAER